VRPAVTETTALGAAYLAGLATGLYAGTDELSALWRAERRFLPTLPREEAAQKMAAWHAAVTRVVS
jgi:glycerol kinase